MFDELVRSVVERNLEIVKQIQKSRISQRRKLRNLITTLMTSYGEHYQLFCVYILGNLSDVSDKRSEWSADIRKFKAETSDAVIAIIDQGYADKSFRNVGAVEIGKTCAEMLLPGLKNPY